MNAGKQKLQGRISCHNNEKKKNCAFFFTQACKNNIQIKDTLKYVSKIFFFTKKSVIVNFLVETLYFRRNSTNSKFKTICLLRSPML
jgi:hypothetical protein